MANTATKLDAIKLFDKRRVVGNYVIPVIVNIDTGDSAVEVADVTAATRNLAIVGLEYAATNAHKLTILSDNTEIAVFDVAAKQVMSLPMGDELSALALTKVGEALNIKASAATGKILVYVVELDA